MPRSVTPRVSASDLSPSPAERSARDFLPPRRTLPALRAAAQHCRGCDLYKNATHVVFGEGARNAECMFIGEQPGNEEDLQGKPFVGPAGKILDKALADAGIARDQVYTTNAVKHFKHEVQGKRRRHKSPNKKEIRACRPWLEQELAITKPRVLVCLGVSAAVSLLERKVTLKDLRGRFFETPYSTRTFVTTHPSSVLRSITSEDRHRKYAELVADLRLVAKELNRS